MKDEVPFGFVGEKEEKVNPFIVHDRFVYHECGSRRDWIKLSDYQFPVERFSEDIRASMLREMEARNSYKLLKKGVLNIQFRHVVVLVDELKWRGIKDGQISLIMHPWLFKRLAYIAALGHFHANNHQQEMLGEQALLLNGVFIPVCFCRFLPEFQINRVDRIKMIVVADTMMTEAELKRYERVGGR